MHLWGQACRFDAMLVDRFDIACTRPGHCRGGSSQ